MRAQWHEFRLRLKALFLRRRIDRDMAEELAFHQFMLREKAMREGANTEEAAAAARKAFGNPSRWQERLRELWQFQPLENLLRDFSFSVRMLAKSPGFTLVAVVTLALGFGANMAIFSLINALLLRPLPVPHSEQLVLVGLDLHSSFGLQYGLSAPMVRELEKQKDEFSVISGFNTDPEMQVRNTLGNQKVVGQFVTGQFFETLQTPPLMGRVLGREDDREGGNSSGWAVVISEGFWHRWFASEGQVVGRKLIINNVSFTVVGVMPQKFFGADPTHRPEFFVPLASEPVLHAPKSYIAMGDHAWWLTAVGRLRPGASLSSVNAELAARTMQMLRATQWDEDNLRDAAQHHHVFVAEPGARGYTYLRMAFGRPLTAIFAMCCGILLLSCVNLASLLLARSASRTQELATRLALGAGRIQLVRQMLMESFMVVSVGVAAGLVIAPMTARSLAVMLLGDHLQKSTLDTSIDSRVWLFAILMAMVSSIAIGLVPALRATSGSLQRGLRQGRTMEPGERRRWMPRVLLASEVSLAIILLVGAGLFSASLMRLYHNGAGFDAKGVVGLSFDMDRKNTTPQELIELYQQIGDELQRQPGVRQVSFASVMPLIGMQRTTDLSSDHVKDQQVDINRIAPHYFDTLHIPLLHGRDFRWSDCATDTAKVLLNQKAAKMLFGDQDPVGQTISDPQGDGKPAKVYEVIGVVSDTKYSGLREKFSPIAYFALTQDSGGTATYFALVRTNGAPGEFAAAARDIAHRLAPDIPAPAMMTMESILNDSISSERMMAMLSAYFAGCALLVTAIGLYGTLSYETARRTSEIGIRMALGAQRGQVVRMVFQENAWVAVTGAAAGLILALLGARLLASFLYQTSEHDPWVIVVSVCALVGVACGASLAPAVKAAYVDPMIAIRTE